jgi:hypothetical protein
MIKVSLLVATALLTMTSWLDARACGDSLYRVGTGVSYRQYTAPLPGNVLIYGKSENASELAAALALAGHRVKMVDNELALDVEIQVHRYDVVIARYADSEAVEDSGLAAGTTFLPVAANKLEAAAVEQRYEQVMIADRHELKHYLKAIHLLLKSHRA